MKWNGGLKKPVAYSVVRHGRKQLALLCKRQEMLICIRKVMRLLMMPVC